MQGFDSSSPALGTAGVRFRLPGVTDGRGESGWCSDVISIHGAWRHAGVRFLLSGDVWFAKKWGTCARNAKKQRDASPCCGRCRLCGQGRSALNLKSGFKRAGTNAKHNGICWKPLRRPEPQPKSRPWRFNFHGREPAKTLHMQLPKCKSESNGPPYRK